MADVSDTEHKEDPSAFFFYKFLLRCYSFGREINECFSDATLLKAGFLTFGGLLFVF